MRYNKNDNQDRCKGYVQQNNIIFMLEFFHHFKNAGVFPS